MHAQTHNPNPFTVACWCVCISGNMDGWLIHNVADNQAAHLCMTLRNTLSHVHYLTDKYSRLFLQKDTAVTAVHRNATL